MARKASARVLIEPNNQYTTISTWSEDGVDGTTIIAITQNQTLAVAFNKARDDIATLLTNGYTAREVSISARISNS